MEQEQQHPESHLFTVRLWEEVMGDDKTEWRGRVQNVASGEVLYFRDWPGLTPTLRRLLGMPADAMGKRGRGRDSE